MYSDLNHSYQEINDIQSQIVQKEFSFQNRKFIVLHQRIKFSAFKSKTLYTQNTPRSQSRIGKILILMYWTLLLN